MFYFLIFLLIIASIALITFSLLDLRQRPRLRLPADTTIYKKPGQLAQETSIMPRFSKPFTFLRKQFSRLAYFRNLQEQADVLRLNVNFEGVILFKILFTILMGVLVAVLFTPAYALLAALVGFFVPDFIMWYKIKGKKAAIVRVFPETVDLLDMCISAGQDFISAIKWLIEKSEYNPFIEQLGVVLSEIQVGKTRSDALRDMARRLKIPDISSFSRTIIQAERMGTSIEEAFRNLSEDTRDRRFQAGERYAIQASLLILMPLLFCILPAIMIVVAGPIVVQFMQGDFLTGGKGF